MIATNSLDDCHPEWPESAAEALEWLGYSPPDRRDLHSHLDSLSRRPAHPGRDPFDLDRAVVVIAYADHITGAPHPPLRSLDRWLRDLLDVPGLLIHLLPPWIAEGDGGFAVTDPRRVNPAFGSHQDLLALVEARQVCLDLVMSHVGASSAEARTHLAMPPTPDGFLAELLGPPRVPHMSHRGHVAVRSVPSSYGPRWLWSLFGPRQFDVNYANPGALRWLVDLAAHYVAVGARALRLDSVGQTWRSGERLHQHARECKAIVHLVRRACDQVEPGVTLLAQADFATWPQHDYLGPPGAGADLLYRHELAPLITHALLAGDGSTMRRWIEQIETENDRRWTGFLSTHDAMFLRPWAYPLDPDGLRVLVDACIQAGGELEWSDYGGGPVVAGLCTTVASLLSGSPDEIAYDRVVLAHAILLSLPGVPALYFGALTGEPNWRTWRNADASPRTINRRRIPSDEFVGRRAEERLACASLVADLVRTRHATSALWARASIQALETAASVLAWDRGNEVRCVFNLGSMPVRVPVPPCRRLAGTAPSGGWLELPASAFSWLRLADRASEERS